MANTFDKINDAITVAGKSLAGSVAEIQAAQKAGDADALFEAVTRAAKPANIVKRARVIVEHPERYENADENFKTAAQEVMALDPKKADALALADGISRLNSAKRRYSAVRNVEKMLSGI